VEGLTSKGTTAAAVEQNGAEQSQTPASSPLMEEVSPDHPMRDAMETAEAERQAGGFGRPGKAMNRRSPFFIGMTGAAGS